MALWRVASMLWLVTGLLGLAWTQGDAQIQGVPGAAPAGAGQAEGAGPVLFLSPGATSGGQLYQTWPLMLVSSIRLDAPALGDAPRPDLTITSRQGAWQEALVVTIRDANGAAVRWPLHLTPSDETRLVLGGSGAESVVRWWLTGDETRGLVEGSYTVTVAFDPERVDGLPTEGGAVEGGRFELRVDRESEPLSAELQQEKLYQEGRLALLQGDPGAAEGAATRLLAQDPQSIGARRVQAAVAVSQGKPAEALVLLDQALTIYEARFPDACPPGGLLSEYEEILASASAEPPAVEGAAEAAAGTGD